jgi:hypothetical protein
MRILGLLALGLAFLFVAPVVAQEIYLRLPLWDLAADRPLVGLPVQVIAAGPGGGELIQAVPGPDGILESALHISQVVSLTVSAPGYLPTQVTDLQTCEAHDGDQPRVLLIPAEPVRLAPIGGPLIPWSPGHPLSWADFQGEVPSDPGPDAARIHIVVSYRLTIVVHEEGPGRWRAYIPRQSLVTQCAMDPARSWVRPDAEVPEVLAHEQGHFDLGEVYRRLLVQKLTELSVEAETSAAARSGLERLAAEQAGSILARLEAAQIRYDEETAHGTDPAAQAAWLSRIRTWLIHPELAP